MRAAVDERDAGPGDQVLDRARHEHLAGAGLRRDPRADVDGDAADLRAHHLALAGVHAGTQLEPQRPGAFADRLGATDGARRAVERGEETVARGIDLAAAESLELAAGDAVERIEDGVPARVAELRGALGRADDVGEQDRREDAIRRAAVALAG